MTSPVLNVPVANQPFVFHSDASDVGLGAVLSQVGEDGEEHPIAYASRKIKPREVRYSTIEKECLAAVWAVKHFKHYLYQGRIQDFSEGGSIKRTRAKILKPRPLFEEPHRFACVFNGCFSYRSKNYAKVSEIKSLLATIHVGKGFY